MKVIALVNRAAHAGDADTQQAEVTRALAEAGIDAEVRAVAADQFSEAVRQAGSSPVDVVVVGGGDGTLSSAAAALLTSGKPLGILPLGTLNHFAKDLGVPLDIDDAARAIAGGNVRRVDVASVNDRIFLNNASIGVYPEVVRDRDQQREQRGRGKWTAFALASARALRRLPILRLRCDAGAQSLPLVTPFLFVGNNCYVAAGSAIGGRARLDQATMCVYYGDHVGRLGMLRLALRTLVGRLAPDSQLRSLTASALTIDSLEPGRSLQVATDGEVSTMATPLRFQTHPGALRVIAPPAEG